MQGKCTSKPNLGIYIGSLLYLSEPGSVSSRHTPHTSRFACCSSAKFSLIPIRYCSLSSCRAYPSGMQYTIELTTT
ncbi:hypothetical protein P154DRAFT_193441 [Amniculicola lignicola CBS 123094]|uniref:Uncharacterized protein n=1 Tax=Amniculicola lignicola CBS 123094 TaxID=1392246 RepID=A0A6A5WGF4_9PLEO|nr:hypothetical protein P154DRAFT_193441 [Amniculicola lignicola CBS 123094]